MSRLWAQVTRLDRGLGAALVLGAVAWLPLVTHPGFLSTRAGGDSPFLLVRLQQLVVALRDGAFPVRWMPDAAYGLGYPFFNYYAPLPYYLAAVWHFLGFGYIGALKLTQVFGFMLASAGAYWLGRDLWRSRPAGLLVSLAYTYAPFHLVNVYVRGDSLGEFYAFAFYPLIFLALRRLRAHPTRRGVAWLGLAYAGLILSHNISALIFSPFVGLYLLALLLDWTLNKERNRVSNHYEGRRYLGLAMAGLTLGLALSAWYWLPALVERKAVQLQENLTGYFHYSGHFRGPELLQLELLFNYALTDEHTPFVVGLAQAAAIALGLAGWLRRRRFDAETISLILTLLVAIAFITPLSAPLWARIPLLPFAQFPWRFLSVVAFASAVLAGALVHLVPQASTLRWPAAGLAGLVLLVAGLARLPTHFIALNDADVTPENLALYEWFTGNIGSTVRAEYLPATINPRPHSSAVFLNGGVKPPPLTLEGEVGEASLVHGGAAGETWSVEVRSSQARLAFHTYAFPGWRASVDGRPAPVEAVPGLGYLAVTVPAGHHTLNLGLGRTPIRLAAEIMAGAAALAAVWLLLREPINRPRLGRWAGGVALVLLVTGGMVRLAPVSPPTDLATVTMDFHRDPYPHANPAGVPFGDEARLQGYSLSAQEVEPGETLEVVLTWDVVPADAQVMVALASPVEAIFGHPDLLAADARPIGATTRHRLAIPSDAPRGVYLPKVEVSDEKGSLGAVYLRPVWVSRGATPSSPAIARFGHRIALIKANARRLDRSTLEVDLTWQALGRIPLNYATSVRLLDATGRRVAQRDVQPRYGFFPTSAWEPGEIIADRRWLALPEDLPPGQDYALEVIVYDRVSLQPIGTTRVPRIALLPWPVEAP